MTTKKTKEKPPHLDKLTHFTLEDCKKQGDEWYEEEPLGLIATVVVAFAVLLLIWLIAGTLALIYVMRG